MQQVSLFIVILASAFFGASGRSAATDLPPRADAGPDRDAHTGEPIMFDGGNSIDRDGNILNYLWDFGDGTRAIGITPRHVFWRPGTYRVKLTVRDDSGRPGNVQTDEAIIAIKRRPNMSPKAHIGISGSVLTRVGEPILFDGSKSSDPDGNILVYEWDFGNGAKTRGVAPVYTYQQEGRYNVTLTVTDDFRNPAGVNQSQITLRVKPRAMAGKAKE